MPPIALWVRGTADLGAVAARSVSVIGSRAATPYGTFVAGELGHGLADRGWTVVSGGAYGVDGAAHRGALAGGRPTVAVLASGVDRPTRWAMPGCSTGSGPTGCWSANGRRAPRPSGSGSSSATG